MDRMCGAQEVVCGTPHPLDDIGVVTWRRRHEVAPWY